MTCPPTPGPHDGRLSRLLLQAAGEGVYGLDCQGVTTFVNPAAARMLGYDPEELVGRPMHAVLHHSHPDGTPYPSHACPVYGAIREGDVQTVCGEVFWRRDGFPFPVEYTSTPVLEDGHVIGAVVVFRDVSERVRAERELRTALDEVQALKNQLHAENEYLQHEIRTEQGFQQVIGDSAPIRRALEAVRTVARTDAGVLITGETGTGKELIARAVHERSARGEKPLIKVNCASIPHELFESEFFGHVRGAFTGAVRDRVGRFELADKGTLFLDEVGEIPMQMQAKLLRVLQEGTYERVGDARTRTVDVRVIAATNRDLLAEVAAGRFREDLYYRLNVFPIPIAPLRHRSADIPPLAVHFFQAARIRLNRPDARLTEANITDLQAYDWPGNVRELQNCVERAIIRAARSAALNLDLPSTRPVPVSPPPMVDSTAVLLTDAEVRHLERSNTLAALRTTDWKIYGSGGAADLLGIPPTTLASRIRTMGLRRDA